MCVHDCIGQAQCCPLAGRLIDGNIHAEHEGTLHAMRLLGDVMCPTPTFVLIYDTRMQAYMTRDGWVDGY